MRLRQHARDVISYTQVISMMNYTDREDDINMEQVVNSTLDVVQPNKIIQGEIVTVDKDFAYVNVGTKSEGRVSKDEFEKAPAVGTVIDVMLVSRRMVDGMFVFSHKAAEREKKWQKFMEWYRGGNVCVSGRIKSSGKNGMMIDCDGISAFLPFSLAADIRFKKAQDSKNLYWFKIKSVDEKKGNIVLSRKEYLDEEVVKIWSSFLEKYKIGSRVRGKVSRFVTNGAIVEIEGLEAFLSREDMSWKKVFKKKKVFSQEGEGEFVILSIDPDSKKISVGLKQLVEDPWLTVTEKYHIGDVIEGKISTITSFGLFIEVDEYIEGLVSSSDISWTKRTVNPQDLFTKGQTIKAKILNIDQTERKMSLGIKQALDNPWDTIDKRYPLGTIMKRPIKKILAFGMFVEIEEDVDGLIHVSDISWEDNYTISPSDYRVGDEVEFKILEYRKADMRISCGIKQLTVSPWEVVKEKYPPRSRVAGVISTITNFGVFVKLEDNIEGLVHISELSKRKIENIEEHFKIGDKVNAIVMGVDVDRKRLSLSIKHYDMMVEKEELNKILKSTSSSTVTFGDLLKDKLGD